MSENTQAAPPTDPETGMPDLLVEELADTNDLPEGFDEPEQIPLPDSSIYDEEVQA